MSKVEQERHKSAKTVAHDNYGRQGEFSDESGDVFGRLARIEGRDRGGVAAAAKIDSNAPVRIAERLQLGSPTLPVARQSVNKEKRRVSGALIVE
jgi:hypothetical protein